MNITLAPSPAVWAECVCERFDEFLVDHAANERKASSMALSMVAHYPDRPELVREMVDLALEELTHFKQVIRLMHDRNLTMPPDEKDPYVNALRTHLRRGPDAYFLDRLISAAVIEARGEERFRLLSEQLQDDQLAAFYHALANSEQGHHQLFLDLAVRYFPVTEVSQRVADWIAIEKSILDSLPIRSRLH